jgi:hypothetical protein
VAEAENALQTHEGHVNDLKEMLQKTDDNE